MAGAFAASKGGYGYRRVKAMLRTRVSEKVLRGIMAEDGLTAHVPERRRTPLFDHIQVWNTWTPSTGSRGRRTRPAPGPHPGPARRNGRRRPCPPDRPAGTRTPSRFASIFLKQFLYYFSAV
nr:IS3 family transposase [Bifidobacterium pseudocatenulatum]